MPVMSMDNVEVAECFTRVADMLEIKGENTFRVRAYRNTARVIESLPQSVAEMVEKGEDLTELPGVGKDLAGKIAELVTTGRLPLLEELEREIPADVVEIMHIAGMGGKRVKELYEQLHIRSLKDLEKAAHRHRIRELPGFGEKTEHGILEGLVKIRESGGRLKIATARRILAPLLDHLRETKGVVRLVTAGSFRRRKETVGDLDILVTCTDRGAVMDRFVAYGSVRDVVQHGTTRSSVLLKSGVAVDLRAVDEESYGAALVYFTGSQAHNIAIRQIAVGKKLKINEYGVFRADGTRVAGRTEAEVYAAIGLPYIEPELREARGEVEAARAGRLPKLVTVEDIRGDLHTHTTRTDGRYSLEEMARAARERGYAYIANTEHSRRLTMVHGLHPKDLVEWLKEVDRVQRRVPDIAILKGIEVDILEDGTLDLPDDVLGELDLCVCSVHSKFNLPKKLQTARILRAMDNRCCTVLAHPTGRLIGERDPYDADMEKVIAGAAERGVILEVNASPDRLDLSDIYCKRAKELGAKLAIDTDAHSIHDYGNIACGVGQARRGWLERDDVVNTRPLKELRKILAARR